MYQYIVVFILTSQWKYITVFILFPQASIICLLVCINVILIQFMCILESQVVECSMHGELLYTKILEVNLFALAYRLFHEDFSSIKPLQSLATGRRDIIVYCCLSNVSGYMHIHDILSCRTKAGHIYD